MSDQGSQTTGAPPICYTVVSLPVPFDEFMVAATAEGLCWSAFVDQGGLPALRAWATRHCRGVAVQRGLTPLLARARDALQRFFSGRPEPFTVPLDLRGTAFQRAVWWAVLAVPFGRTATYAQIAAQIGRPRAVRAVGAANGANPLTIFVPCHRLVGRNGDLCGYGGGLPRKSALLTLERRVARQLSEP
ncbi:MAG: methylated-DNA--[protein]-cysteine S-methyltransferase [Ardenticatenaceae bacterium]|nr:methylated-DNA--[protein]-cysteine S-methyltransferase [Ardenticatenaceae bacterium]